MIQPPPRTDGNITTTDEERRRDALVIALEFMPHARHGVSLIGLASQMEAFLKDGTVPS